MYQGQPSTSELLLDLLFSGQSLLFLGSVIYKAQTLNLGYLGVII